MKKAKKTARKPAHKPTKKTTPAKHGPHLHVTITKKILGKAPEHYSFVLHDGRKMRSVLELIDELETMTEDQFHNYVSDVENHFANWIRDVFEEPHLAEEMRAIKTRMDTQRALLKHLVRDLIKERAEKKK